MTERGQDTKERILDTAQALAMAKGFSATSLDDIIRGAGLTKGAFFHYFRSKGDLAQRLAERFAERDFALFDELGRRADALADDPYQALHIYIKLFEEWLDNLPEPFAGCLFAVYVYESNLFEPAVNEFIRESFERWEACYEARFAAAMAARPPRIDITAHDLAVSLISLLEGSFILARAHRDPGLITRQSRLFRSYLKLVFGDDSAAGAGTAVS